MATREDIDIEGQRFGFEVDHESVTLYKGEVRADNSVEELGTVLIYANQLDGVIAKLTEIRDSLNGPEDGSDYDYADWRS